MTSMAYNESETISKLDEKTDKNNRLKDVLIGLLKIAGLLGCLYFFVVSLNLMSISFPLIGGRYASEGTLIMFY